MKTDRTDSVGVNGKPRIVEGARDDRSQREFDEDLRFLQSALSQGEERQVDVAAVQLRAGRIVRRRVAFRTVAAAAGILIGAALFVSVATREPDQAVMPVVSDAVDLEFIRSAVAELEYDLNALEREIARPRQAPSDFAASVWIATAAESFEEGTAAMLLTAARHRQEAGSALADSKSRFEEIVTYFPGTLAASAAREYISQTEVQAN